MDEASAPAAEAELAARVRAAAAARTPLEITGGGSRRSLGRPVQAAGTLSTRQLAGVLDYRPGELSITVGAGTPLAEVLDTIASHRQMLAFEPPDWRQLLATPDRTPTIGGTVATASSGPRAVVAGGCRDALTGLRFVNGRGEAIVSGGRVMKNVTGYNLAHLLCGSFGTLGILTELSLRTAPLPEAEATIMLAGLDVEQAVRAMAMALATPHGVSGAARIPAVDQGDSRTCLRIEGLQSSIVQRCDELTRQFVDFGRAEVLSAQASKTLWADIRDLRSFGSPPGVLWRVMVRPSHAPHVIAALESRCGSDYLLDRGGAVVWLRTGDPDAGGAELIRRVVDAAGGHATLFRADPQLRLTVPWQHPPSQPLGSIHTALRAKFDPEGILNPGRMGS